VVCSSERQHYGKECIFYFILRTILFFEIFLLSALDKGTLLIRLCFLTIAIFLPASLYFLFIAARRESLFNAFATNLSRLGLLRRWWTAGPSTNPTIDRKTSIIWETPTCFRRRIKSYFDRFVAVYGSPEEKNARKFIEDIGQECSVPVADTGGSPADGWNTAGTFDFPTIIPVLGATCLLALGWVCTLPPQNFQPYDYHDGNFSTWFSQWAAPTNSPVIFAFLGAYFFSLQMIIKRFVRHDLGANAYNAISLRIILAIVGVWIAIRTFEAYGLAYGLKVDEKAPIVQIASFAVGAFPLVVWQLLTAALKKFPPFQAALPNLTCSQPLDAIDGLSYWAQVRLEEEGIESVPNLATADLVDLMLNTKIPPHRIIDWVDQAILLTYLGTEGTKKGQGGQRSLRDELNRYGIRTAAGLESALRCCSNSGVLTGSVADNQQDRLSSIVAAMRDCPNFVLIRNWRGIADDPEIAAVEESELNEALQYPRAA
jgi:hypothetical protein